MKKVLGLYSNPDQHWVGDGMLDKPTKDMEPAPGWRFLKFLGFGDNRDKDKAVEPNAKTPPKEPEERKQQFATWYIFAAFLGVMLIQYLWVSSAQTRPFRTVSSSSCSRRTKPPKSWSAPRPSRAR